MQLPKRHHIRWSYIFSFLFSLYLYSLLSSPVLADRYVFENGRNNNYYDAQVIVNPQEYQYLYAILNRGEDTADYYQITLAEYVAQFHISVMVLDKESTKSFKPSLALIDPNQRSMIGKVPFGFPQTVGGRVYAWEDSAPKKSADDTVLENFIVGPSLVKDLAPGRYIIGIFDPEATGGRYVLRLGAKAPKETIRDKFAAVLAFLRIKFSLY